MNLLKQSLSFSSEPWLVLLSVAICLATVGLSYFSWRRSGWSKSVLGLEFLRVFIVVLGAILLNQPEWVQEFRSEQKPTLVVLSDASLSMQTRDVVMDPSANGTEVIHRSDAIKPLLDSDVWKSLESRMNIAFDTFPSEAAVDGTDINGSLQKVFEGSDRLLGVVLISDGDWNLGQPPIDAAMRYRSQGVPIIAIPVGAETRLPDIELLSVDTPTFGITNKGVRIPFAIESSLPRDHVANVVVTASDGERLTKEVRIKAMSRTNDSVSWVPKNEGDYTIKVEIPKHPEELIDNNNEQSTPITIRQEKLKVLVIDSYPRWEYRYLRNALSRDPGVEVSCLLFHPGLNKVGGGNRDYIKAFPETQEELAVYDVVFLGDVGVEHGQLTTEQCKLLRGLVEYQASGIVFIPGWQGEQLSLQETELEPLIPVMMDPAQPKGNGSRSPMKFELTETGRRSLLTRLADTQDENLDAWDALPGFQWYASVIRAKAGTEVLSVHHDASNEYGRIPLLVTKTFGAGKVLFMATDGAWRWRKGVEDKYHYRFWGQVVRWMAYQRNMAKGESMRFYFNPDQPQINQTLALRANVMETSGEPLSSGDVTVRITAPSGKFKVIQLASAGTESWGAFDGRYTVEEPGSHTVVLACKQTGATLNTSFFVQGKSRERVGQPAKPNVLEELARVTKGKVLSLKDQSNIADAIGAIPDPPSTLRRFQLWAHPLTIAVMLVGLTIFWTGRKWVGLI